MKKLLMLVFISCSANLFAQQKPIVTNSTVSSLKWKVDSKEELESIKWADVKKMFKDNVKTDTVSLAFEVKKSKRKNIKSSYSFQVKGLTENIDRLITIAKKGIRKI